MVDLGEKLSDRYHITHPIGQGGMANVYLARDLILDRDVAVKVLRFDFQEDQDAIRRFQREAMSATQLLHHNIVEVYDVNEEEGQQYIVMEYVKGTDLKTYIRENRPIPLEVVVNIMSQILSGIDLAHRNGIIHRDIKPQNILITSDNEVKITDFGIAIALTDTSITQTNTLLGSVHYLSPEQARGNSATTKSDIYALGVVLYELITGEVPFDGESAVSVALKHFQEAFPRILPALDYVPQSLENVVLKATAKDPQDRYANVQEMLQDLSTSLSATRMNEKRFIPASQLEETIVINPIQTTNKSSVTSKPEVKEEIKIEQYDEVQPLSKPRRRSKWLRYLLYFLLVVLVGFGIYWVYDRMIQTVTVPALVNLSQEEALQELEEAGLIVGDINHAWDQEIKNGNVISSQPSLGQRVDRGSAVSLLISSGKEQVKVGDYVGENYESIRRLLTNAEFIVERRDLFTSDPAEEGMILAQSVEAGTAVVPSNTPITLTVGSTAANASMQDFYNLSLDLVYNFADGYGLYVTEEYEYSDYIPEGQIISQEPHNGTPLSPGDTIHVVVSAGPEEDEIATISETFYIEYVPHYADSDVNQEKPLPNKIQVFIGDSKNKITELAQEFELTESRTIQITLFVPGNGRGQYRILRDGEVVDESNEVYPY